MTTREKAISIVQRLRERGHEAYLAGGCVRDDLLNRPPQDYDIATSALPDEIQKLFPRTVPVGAQFGVIMVIVEGESFAVSTFRFDGPYLDGRRPSHVRFTNMREDILRRDFTINGMMYDPEKDAVIDLVGGQEDLRRGIVRAIGDPRRRFEEDRLRMVRAIRLAAALGFRIDDETLQAIREQHAHILQVAWERIGEEITRILTEGGARRGFELLDATGLLGDILPEVEAMKGVEQSPDYHPEGDVFTHTMAALGYLERPSESLAYGCLLHDVAKPVCIERRDNRITFYGHTDRGAEMAVDILKRLKRSRATWERVAYLVKNHLRPTQAPHMRLSTLKRFLAAREIDELLELCRIDALAANGDLRYYEFCRAKLAELKEEELHPKPLLLGRDLIAMGFKPGPRFSDILQAVEEAQLSGEIRTKDEAQQWVAERYLQQEDR
ncbi:MAG TPA: CCA tRNA nucleotidyltransferase [Candidatus Acidoferrales bacterium]|nr:CCA tRNA nucleotidyltransferase [Candidatus Acidoferrales bacterium]